MTSRPENLWCEMAVGILFPSQSRQRVDSCRTARRNQTGTDSHERNACQGDRHAAEVVRLQAIQLRCQRFAGEKCEWDTNDRAERGQHKTIAEHHPNDLRALRA